MGEREDRIVLECDCEGCVEVDAFERGSWNPGNPFRCNKCGSAVRAINIDRLLRVEEAALALVRGPRRDGNFGKRYRALKLALLDYSETPNSSSRCDGSCADWDAECGGGCDG